MLVYCFYGLCLGIAGLGALWARYARRTFEYPHRSRKVVDSPCGSEGSGDDGRRGHEIVGEGVVQIPLQLEDVLDLLELLLVSAVTSH